MFHLWHRWTKWVRVRSGKIPMPYETRECTKCHKRQFREIKVSAEEAEALLADYRNIHTMPFE